MNKNIYLQTDKRWKSLGYPTKAYSFGRNACGCCSCLHVLIELDKYKDWKPPTIRSYMVKSGFATYGNGTTWDGIAKTLKHYGFQVNHYTSSSMNKVFKLLNKRDRCWGVLLFKSGRSPGGVKWTNGGHYVAFVEYKKQGNKHYFYCKDSANGNNGWFSYESGMRGPLSQIWVAYSSDTLVSGSMAADTGKINSGSDMGPSDDSETSEASTVTVSWEQLNPYIVSASRYTPTLNIPELKTKKVIGCMIHAGTYFDSNHRKYSSFRDPKAYDHAVNCTNNSLDFGYYFRGRARTVSEADEEMYELSFLVRKHPPTLGVWIVPEMSRKKSINKIIIDKYEKELVRLGLTDKMGIYCKRSTISVIPWDDIQNRWWLWLEEKVKNLSEIQQLLDPKFFDIDGKSGPVIGGGNRDTLIGKLSNSSSNSTKDTSSNTTTWKGSKLTKRKGVNNGPSGRETYYNLNMNYVVKLMHNRGFKGKYWVRGDGCKMFGSYIMIAANLKIRPYGTKVMTSLGMGIVCDTGDFVKKYPKGIDIAVNW